MVPQFETLKHDDRVYLAQASWNEIVIADVAHRSIDYDVSSDFLALVQLSGHSRYWQERLVDAGPGTAQQCRSYIRAGYD